MTTAIKKYNFYIAAMLFLFIYNPPFISTMVIHLQFAYSIFAVFFKKNYQENFVKTFKRSKLLILSMGMIIAIAYMILQGIILGSLNIGGMYIYFILGIEMPIVTTHIILYLREKKYSFDDFIIILLMVGTIQSLIALFAFMIPPLHQSLVKYMVDNGITELYLTLNYRIYGFSRTLSSATPVVQSILAVFAFYYGINKNLKYFLYVPLLIFSGIINARISLLVLAIGFCFVILYSDLISSKTLLKFIWFTAITLLLAIVTPFILQKFSPITYEWILNGLFELASLSEGEKVGTFSILFSKNFLKTPSGIQFLFGRGYNIFGLKYGSDIGYVNDLWLGGIIICAVLYITIINFYRSVYKKDSKIKKFTALFFISLFLVYNIKGIYVANNEITALTMIVIAYSNIAGEDKINSKILDINILPGKSKYILTAPTASSYLQKNHKQSVYFTKPKSDYQNKFKSIYIKNQ